MKNSAVVCVSLRWFVRLSFMVSAVQTHVFEPSSLHCKKFVYVCQITYIQNTSALSHIYKKEKDPLDLASYRSV